VELLGQRSHRAVDDGGIEAEQKSGQRCHQAHEK
jgi:hypothetical protein